MAMRLPRSPRIRSVVAGRFAPRHDKIRGLIVGNGFQPFFSVRSFCGGNKNFLFPTLAARLARQNLERFSKKRIMKILINHKERRCTMKKGLLEKVILSGLGLASLTQEKAQKLVEELVKEGEMSEQDGAVMAKKVMDNLEKSRREMEKKTDKAVKEVVGKLTANVPTKKDIAALEKKIDELSKKLESKKTEVKK